MNAAPCLPRATRARLENPAPPGQRHAEIVKIAVALVAQGFNSEAIFCQIRPNYSPDLPDGEIRAIVSWAGNHFCGNPAGPRPETSRLRAIQRPFSAPNFAETPVSVIERFLDGFRCEEVDLWERSPIRLEWGFPKDPFWLLSSLFRPDENVNIVTDSTVSGGKGHPIGRGTTKKRVEWAALFEKNGPPNGKMGVWIRPNPTDGNGVSDSNIVVFRFLLVEFDTVPIDLQLPFLTRLPLPISAIITSGGKSLHAWVRIDAETAAEYRAVSDRIFAVLEPFGADTANRNPGRLSRLPGVRRENGDASDGLQRLLYLNPDPNGRRIIE